MGVTAIGPALFLLPFSVLCAYTRECLFLQLPIGIVDAHLPMHLLHIYYAYTSINSSRFSPTPSSLLALRADARRQHACKRARPSPVAARFSVLEDSEEGAAAGGPTGGARPALGRPSAKSHADWCV